MLDARALISVFAAALACGCAAVDPASVDDDSAALTPSSLEPFRGPDSVVPDVRGAHLDYYGGPVISNVRVHTIFWGRQVQFQSQLNAFYGAITDSEYFDWLDEYATPTQHIGRGSFAGGYVDTGPPAGTTITNSQIQAELTRLIDAHHVPSPTANDLYMIHFPPGVTVTFDDGSASCADFCAYHSTFTHGSHDVFYGVIPDLGGACASGCGSGAQLDNTTAASSHEMIEAVTDSAVGLATSLAAPLGWYDQANGEIGDICVGQDATVAGFTVQTEWSNSDRACIATRNGGGGGGGHGGGGGGGHGGGGGGGGSCNETEPNDTAAQASSICSTGTMLGTIGSTGDVDWYELDVKKGGRYTITLSSLPADYDLMVYHASASGKLSWVGTAPDKHDRADEQIAHRSRSGGRYYIKVFGVAGASSTQSYQLGASVQ